MKTNKTRAKKVLVALFPMLMPLLASAHDFMVNNIYYNITDSENLTVEITHEGFYYASYQGSVRIPSTVTYDGKTYSVTRIGSCAFMRSKSLTYINIPSSITTIGDCAFEDCTSLSSVSIPKNVVSIGYRVFQGCSNLSYVNFPNGVTTIGERTFQGCTNLSSFTIPQSVTSIGDYAFSSCRSLTTINIPNGVNNIGNSAFSDCGKLTSITIPESIKNIGDYAFQSCSNLTSVHITSIEAWCCINFEGQTANPFWNAKDLYLNGELVKELIIPNTITKVNDYAFYQCNSITSVTIPQSVTNIGKSAFAGCSSLKKVEMNNSVEIIGDYAFMGCNWLNSVNISESCTYIGASAFFDCRLYDITIPKNVTFIGGNAFEPYGNSDIAIHISDIEAWCKIEFGGYYTEQKRLNLYLNGESISELKIPNTINKIKDYAFYFCANLTSVTIPDNVTSIGKFAFYNCSNLTSVQLSNNLDSIGNFAFQSTALHHIDIPQSITYIGYGAFESCRNITSITIPEGTTYIGNDAFRGCQFTSLKLPKSLSFLGGDAFYGTKWFNNQNDGVVYCDNWVVGYKGSMPENCTIEIAEGTLGIASSAFRSQSNLVSIVLPKTINKILSSTFEYCFNLKQIELPSALTYIGSHAFLSTAIEDIFIPEGVVEIGSHAFMNCEKIRTINIPESVEEIGDYAFWGCYKYADINVCSNPSITPYSYPESAKIHLILSDQKASDFDIDNINTYKDVTYHRELALGKYGTIMLPFAPDAESLENFAFYALTSVNGETMFFVEVDEPKANTPYLFTLREGKSATEITGGATTISSSIIKPVVDGWQTIGSFTNQTVQCNDGYYYAINAEDNMLYHVNTKLNVKPYRAYFKSTATNATKLKVRTRNGGETIIDATEVEDLIPEVYYDLNGRRVENPTKGVYIKNGKKVIL